MSSDDYSMYERRKPTDEEVKQMEEELLDKTSDYRTFSARRNGREEAAYIELAKAMANGEKAAYGVHLNREQRRKLKKAEKKLGDKLWSNS